MGDPLSAVGSILAICSLALQSCEVSCKFFRGFQEANEDVENYMVTIEALKSTLTKVSNLEKDLADEGFLDLNFERRLKGCLLNLKAIENVIKPISSALHSGKARRTWNQMRWVGTYQKQRIERYMSRIQLYHMSFTQDLVLVNTWVQYSTAPLAWNIQLMV